MVVKVEYRFLSAEKSGVIKNFEILVENTILNFENLGKNSKKNFEEEIFVVFLHQNLTNNGS